MQPEIVISQVFVLSGVISTIDELDYETTDTYALEVTVTDGSKQSAPVTLDIVVEDVNEPHTIEGLDARVDLDADNTAANKLVCGIKKYHISCIFLK